MRSRPGSDGKIDQSIHPSIHPSIGYKKVGRATEVTLPLGLTDIVPMPTVLVFWLVKSWLLKVRFSLKFLPAWLAAVNVLKPNLIFTIGSKDILTVVKDLAVLVAPTWATVGVKKVVVFFIIYVHVLIKTQTLYKA
jgi:hypothetical protein